MELSLKQHRFVLFYLGESQGNATDAARRLGYPHPEVAGCRLLRNVKVRAAIDAKLASAAMPCEELLARITQAAQGDLGHFIDINPDGSYRLNLQKAKRSGKTALIKKLKTTKDGNVEIELHSPQTAQDMLCKYYGLYKMNVSVADTTPTTIYHTIDDPRAITEDIQPSAEAMDVPSDQG